MPYLHPATYELPFQAQSETSRNAAVRAGGFHLSQRARILAWFQDQGARGGTQIECARCLGIARASVAPRVNEMWDEGRGPLEKTAARRGGCFVYCAALNDGQAV